MAGGPTCDATRVAGGPARKWRLGTDHPRPRLWTGVAPRHTSAGGRRSRSRAHRQERRQRHDRMAAAHAVGGSRSARAQRCGYSGQGLRPSSFLHPGYERPHLGLSTAKLPHMADQDPRPLGTGNSAWPRSPPCTPRGARSGVSPGRGAHRLPSWRSTRRLASGARLRCRRPRARAGRGRGDNHRTRAATGSSGQSRRPAAVHVVRRLRSHDRAWRRPRPPRSPPSGSNRSSRSPKRNPDHRRPHSRGRESGIPARRWSDQLGTCRGNPDGRRTSAPMSVRRPLHSVDLDQFGTGQRWLPDRFV